MAVLNRLFLRVKKIETFVWILLFVFIINFSILPLHKISSGKSARYFPENYAMADDEEYDSDVDMDDTDFADLEKRLNDPEQNKEFQQYYKNEVDAGHYVEGVDAGMIDAGVPDAGPADAGTDAGVDAGTEEAVPVVNTPNLPPVAEEAPKTIVDVGIPKLNLKPYSLWIVHEKYSRTVKNLKMARKGELESIELRFYPDQTQSGALGLYFEARYHNPEQNLVENLGGDSREVVSETTDEMDPVVRNGMTYGDFVSTSSKLYKHYKDLWGHQWRRSVGGILPMVGGWAAAVTITKLLAGEANPHSNAVKVLKRLKKNSKFSRFLLSHVYKFNTKVVTETEDAIVTLERKRQIRNWYLEERKLRTLGKESKGLVKAAKKTRRFARWGAGVIQTLSNPKAGAFVAAYIAVELYFHWSKQVFDWGVGKFDKIFKEEEYKEREWLSQLIYDAQRRANDENYFIPVSVYKVDGGLTNFVKMTDEQKITMYDNTKEIQQERKDTDKLAWDLIPITDDMGDAKAAFKHLFNNYLKKNSFNSTYGTSLKN